MACLGYPIAGNPTQFVIERAIKSLDLDWRVITCSVLPEQIEHAIAGAKAMRFAGMKLLPPYDVSVIPWLEQRDHASQASGIVQAAKRFDDVWIGADLRFAACIELLASRIEDTNQGCVITISGTEAETSHFDMLLADRFPRFKIQRITIDSSDDSMEIEPYDFWIAISGNELPAKAGHRRLTKPHTIVHSFTNDSDTWHEWAQSKSLTWISQHEWDAFRYSAMFAFWTDMKLPPAFFRDALDEYHPW